jgi:hypothetical protein
MIHVYQYDKFNSQIVGKQYDRFSSSSQIVVIFMQKTLKQPILLDHVNCNCMHGCNHGTLMLKVRI